jgi:hypothetical protein
MFNSHFAAERSNNASNIDVNDKFQSSKKFTRGILNTLCINSFKSRVWIMENSIHPIKSILAAILMLLLCVSTALEVVHAQTSEYRQFQKGMTYFWAWHDTYSKPESDRSLVALSSIGANWVSLIALWYQDTWLNTTIYPEDDHTPPDDSVIHAIRTIHGLGMKVMLKPQVDLIDTGNGHWIGNILPDDVQKWFDSYRNFILHYAQLAKAEGVEQFSVGNELESMTKPIYSSYWIEIIAAIRQSYNGPLVYSAQGEDMEWKWITFWDKLDYVGINAYFSLTNKKDPTLEELRHGWIQYLDDIESLQRTVKKPVVFTEGGGRSIDGLNTVVYEDRTPCGCPYVPTKCKPDLQEQADVYESLLETFWGKSWLQGIFWWSWLPFGLSDGPEACGEQISATSSSPHNKPAEKILLAWYSKPYIPSGTRVDALAALIAMQYAENATAQATRDKTPGLDQAKQLLSEAVAAYNAGNYATSRTLADNAMNLATPRSALSQKMYDEAAAMVTTAFEKLKPLANTTLQSLDAVKLRQQAVSEYITAMTALYKNQFNIAKAHANNATSLVANALAAERNYQTQQVSVAQPTSLTQVTVAYTQLLNTTRGPQSGYELVPVLVVASAVVVLATLVTLKRKRIRK